MYPLSLVHVDDSEEHLKLIKELSVKVPDLKYMAGFSHPVKALSYIRKREPDIVLLDIQFPHQTGLELANALVGTSTRVVFLTAYENYALDAFSNRAMNYLIKPPTREQLTDLVERFRSWHTNNVAAADEYKSTETETGNYVIRRLFVPMVGNTMVLHLDELVLIEAKSNYSIFTKNNGETITSSRSLKLYADALRNHPDFIRSHRSYIVNKNYITNIIRSRENRSFLVLRNGRELEIPNNKKDAVMNRLLL